jgi:[ribosomal protein S5]-alanine N-acetyltransferase
MPIHIETGRLLLRNFVSSDWTDLQKIAIDKAASPYAVYDHQFPAGTDEVKKITDSFGGSDDFWAVRESAAGKVIGFLHLGGETEGTKDFGYTFHSTYWGRGYATEACQAAVAYAFDQPGISRLTSSTADLNLPSVRLLLSLGFQKTSSAVISFAKTFDGQPIEFVGSSYELLKSHWTKIKPIFR